MVAKITIQTHDSGNSRGFRPFAKRDSITVSFRKSHCCFNDDPYRTVGEQTGSIGICCRLGK
jgi:hypothetical protein